MSGSDGTPNDEGATEDEGVATDEGAATPEERRALFQVVRGAPSDAEVVALAVVLAAAASGGDDAPPAARDRWSDPAARMRTVLTPGPGAWRGSYLPR